MDELENMLSKGIAGQHSGVVQKHVMEISYDNTGLEREKRETNLSTGNEPPSENIRKNRSGN